MLEPRAGAARAAAKTIAEKLVEQVAQVDGMRSVRTAGPCRAIRAGTPSVERVAVTVVLHALLGIAQNGIGLLDLFELVGGVFVTRTDVGVIFAPSFL